MQIDIGFPVPLTSKCQDGIRASFDLASNGAGEMHAQKRQGWIRHGIDQAFDETAPLWSHGIVLSPEGDDAEIEARASHARQAVSKESPAVDQELCVHYRL